MRRGLRPLAWPLVVCAAAPLSGQTGAAPVELAANAVRVEAGGKTGFGFIAGLTDEGRMLVATAWHTLEDLFEPVVEVCYHPRGTRCSRGEVVYVADAVGSEPALDVAILSLPYPEGHGWRPDAMAPPPGAGAEVRVIGRSRQWYIPATPGTVVGHDPETRTLTYEDLEVTEGVSGAPVVADGGIAGMHLRSSGAEGRSYGVEIAAIRDRVVDHVGAHWLLVSRPDCEADAPQRALEGTELVVHFDARRPHRALEAMARLACLGVEVRPSLHPAGEAWSENRIAYGRGELRRARALQSALGDFGRLETELSDGAASLMLWIR